MTEWQPIGTAPKNDAGEMLGPTILIWYDADELPWPAYWGPHPDAISEGTWLSNDGTAPFDTALVTHWMPLPEPPIEDAGRNIEAAGKVAGIEGENG